MNRLPFALALPVAIVATLMLPGCGGGTVTTDASSAAPATSAPSETAKEDSSRAPTKSATSRTTKNHSSSSHDLRTELPEVTAQSAVVAAQNSHPGDLLSLELSTVGARMLYQVELASGEDEVDVIIDASDGAVRDTHAERSDALDERDPAISLSDVIDASDAMRAASTIIDVPVESWTLTHNDGRLVYQVDFSGIDREIDVDALTGDVVEIDD